MAHGKSDEWNDRGWGDVRRKRGLRSIGCVWDERHFWNVRRLGHLRSERNIRFFGQLGKQWYVGLQRNVGSERLVWKRRIDDHGNGESLYAGGGNLYDNLVD